MLSNKLFRKKYKNRVAKKWGSLLKQFYLLGFSNPNTFPTP